jgi:hypothetical protein
MLGLAQISSKIDRCSSSPQNFCVRDSAAAHSNSSPGEARGGRGGAVCGLCQAGGAPGEPLDIDRVFAKEATTVRSLRRPPPLEGKQNGISIPLQSYRIKPHGI